MEKRRRVLMGAAVAGLAAVAVGLNVDLQEPPRYDGAGYSVLGLALTEGRGYREVHIPGAPPHAHFPPGYPIALAGLWTLTGRSVVAAHLFSAACTVGAAWVGWHWLRRVEPGPVADLLGLGLACNWTWAVVGGAIQSEPLYLLLSMIALDRAERRRTGVVPSVGLGLVLGGSVLTRHVGACLALAIVVDRVSRRRWREAGLVALTAALVVAPWVAWVAIARRPTQVGLFEGDGLMGRVAGQVLFYLRRLPDALSGPIVEVATVFAGRSRAVSLAATVGAGVVSLILVVGLCRALVHPRRRLAGLVPLVTLPLLLVWPFTEAGRFLIPLVPCLLVGMVEGLVWAFASVWSPPPLWGRVRVGGRSGMGVVSPEMGRGSPPTLILPHKGGGDQIGWGRREQTGRHLAAWLVLLAAIPYPAYAILSGRAEARRRTQADFEAAIAWIAEQPTPVGPVLSRHPAEVYWGTGRPSVEPAAGGADALADQIRSLGVAYLLDDPDRYAGAPATPIARFVAERPGAVRVVRDGAVRVFEVDRLRPDSGP